MCYRISSIRLYSFLIEVNNQRISSIKLVLLFNRTNQLAHVIVCATGLVRLNWFQNYWTGHVSHHYLKSGGE